MHKIIIAQSPERAGARLWKLVGANVAVLSAQRPTLTLLLIPY